MELLNSNLETVARFGLFSHNIEHVVNKFSPLRIMPLRPVVPCPTLALNSAFDKGPMGTSVPKMKLSGRKSCPKGPALTESIVPGSRSMKLYVYKYSKVIATDNLYICIIILEIPNRLELLEARIFPLKFDANVKTPN